MQQASIYHLRQRKEKGLGKSMGKSIPKLVPWGGLGWDYGREREDDTALFALLKANNVPNRRDIC